MDGSLKWSSETGYINEDPKKLLLRDDGNLVLVENETPDVFLWSSYKTSKHPFSAVDALNATLSFNVNISNIINMNFQACRFVLVH